MTYEELEEIYAPEIAHGAFLAIPSDDLNRLEQFQQGDDGEYAGMGVTAVKNMGEGFEGTMITRIESDDGITDKFWTTGVPFKYAYCLEDGIIYEAVGEDAVEVDETLESIEIPEVSPDIMYEDLTNTELLANSKFQRMSFDRNGNCSLYCNTTEDIEAFHFDSEAELREWLVLNQLSDMELEVQELISKLQDRVKSHSTDLVKCVEEIHRLRGLMDIDGGEEC